MAVTAAKPLRDITEFADKGLRRWLESVDGVGQVLVIGGRKRQVNVWLDAELLGSQGLSVNEVARALQAQNADIPGGRIDRGAQSVTLRTRGRVDTVDAFGDIVIREVQGHPVHVRDIGRVEDGMAEAATQASVNGVATVLLQIRKQSGTNTVAVANSIKDRLQIIQSSLPQGYELRIVRDEAQFIEASIAAVEEHLIVGSLLAAGVVLLFLGNLRSTIIAAVAIPTSIIATFALIWYMGFTLNMLTMLALTLSVGIVIDDAIVVLENIYRFIEEKGMPPRQAAIEATREIGLAVMATTLSLVAIFAPVGFMSGIVGRFMASFGLTMAFAVLVSLFVSFTLTPMMSAHWLKAPTEARRRSRLEAQPGVRAARPSLRTHAAVEHGPPRDCRGGHRGGAPLEHPAVPVHGGHLHAAGRHLSVRHHDAGARGHQPGRHRRPRQPGGDGRPQAARGGLHAGHGGGRYRRHAEHRVDLRAPARDRGPRSHAVRGDGRRA